MKGLTIGIIVIAVLIIGGFFLFNSSNEPETRTNTGTNQEVPIPGSGVDEMIVNGNTDTTNDETPDTTNQQNIIEYTSSGYTPSTITINQGDSVTFTNTISRETWPASAIHPTHESYPGSGISKCGATTDIFDACSGLENGESYTFTFNEIGTWSYHNHLRPSDNGKIIVE